MAKSSTSGQGRPKGIPNKHTADLKKMVFGALENGGGQTWLEQQMVDNPVAYMTLLGKFVPRDVNLGGQEDNPVKTDHKVIFEVLRGNVPRSTD